MYKLLFILFLILLYDGLAAQKLDNFSYKELDSLLNTTHEMGNYGQGLLYAKTAKEKALKEFGNQDTIYARYLVWEGFLCDYIGKYSEAEKSYLEAKTIQAKVYGIHHPEYANNINNLASLYKTMCKYELAESMYKEAIAIFEKAYGKEHENYALGLNNLALLYQEMGFYSKAEPLLLQSNAIESQKLDKVSYSLSLYNLAHFNYEMGKYPEAEELYLKAMKIFETTIGKEHAQYAYFVNALGTIHAYMGNYTQAELLYLESQAIQIRTTGKEHPDYANNINNLANLYRKINKKTEAEILLLEAREIYKKTLGIEHPMYANILNGLAAFYQVEKNYKKAEDFYLETIQVQAKTLGKEHRLYAICLTNFAGLNSNMGNYSKAEKLYLEAQSIFEKLFGKDNPNYASMLNEMSELYIKMNQLDKALKFCINGIEANSAQIDSGFYNSPEAWKNLDKFEYYSNYYINISINTLLNILQLQFGQNKDKNKIDILYHIAQSAIRLNEKNRIGMNVEADKLRNLDKNTSFVEKAIQTALFLDNKIYQEEVFSLAELNKSMLLADAIKGNRARALGDLPDTLADKEIILQNQLNDFKKQHYEAKTPEDKELVHKKLNSLNLEIDAFLESLKNKYPKYHALKYENITAKASDIQQLINEKTALLEYFLTDSALYLFVITKGAVKLYPLAIKKEHLKEKIKTLRNALSNYNFILKDADKAYREYNETAFWFYKELVEKGIKGKDLQNLIIVTDGELGHLPFEIFLLEKGNQKDDYKKMSYLVNNYNISYNYSATLFKENLSNSIQKNKAKKSGKMLACAATYLPVDSSLSTIRQPYFYKLRQILKQLPAAQKEIAALAENFQGDFLWNDDANERFFKENAANYSIIHLAMHGILEQKQYLLSSLAFTENRDSVEDNFLQAFEISKLKLNADLVVLSACETGYGKFTQGEGIISIARSFMYAGVPSLVVSLWQVNDASTAMIMKHFYDNLAEGMTKDAALRKAKMDYIQTADQVMAHPAFWSAFIQMGDSRAIVFYKKGGDWWWWVLGICAVVLAGGLWLQKRKK